MKDKGQRKAKEQNEIHERSAVSRKPFAPIGVFDSGAGAYFVAAAIQRKIPNANIVIKTDPKFFPYGDKSSDIIQRRLVHFAKEFQKEDCRIVVIACNSATTNGIMSLRRKFPELLLVGVEPPVKPIVKLTKTGKVAVIGTEATIRSNRLKELVQKFSNGVSVKMIACAGLAEEIEESIAGHSGASLRAIESMGSYRPALSGESAGLQDDALKDLIKKFLDQPIAEGVDVVGIACTHYPYLLPLMKKLYPAVTFYDPTEAVVDQVARFIKIS